jgi:hypothetical protein
MLMIQELAQSAINMNISLNFITINPAVGCNTLLIYIKQTRNNCFFNRKMKELLVKGQYYLVQEFCTYWFLFHILKIINNYIILIVEVFVFLIKFFTFFLIVILYYLLNLLFALLYLIDKFCYFIKYPIYKYNTIIFETYPTSIVYSSTGWNDDVFV